MESRIYTDLVVLRRSISIQTNHIDEKSALARLSLPDLEGFLFSRRCIDSLNIENLTWFLANNCRSSYPSYCVSTQYQSISRKSERTLSFRTFCIQKGECIDFSVLQSDSRSNPTIHFGYFDAFSQNPTEDKLGLQFNSEENNRIQTWKHDNPFLVDMSVLILIMPSD